MKVTEFKNQNLIHACTLYPDSTEDTLIHRFYHIEQDKHEGVVYFICVDDEVFKVGGSTDSIKGLLSQYLMNLNSKGDPMFTRFPIYLMMLYLLCEGHRIDFYYIQVQPYTILLPDLRTGEMMEVISQDFHGFETGYITMVQEITGSIPIWNMAENGNSFDPNLRILWEDRKSRLSDSSSLFDYHKFLHQDWNFLGG